MVKHMTGVLEKSTILKQGHGSPLLLVHDIMPGASGYEWNAVENQLATEHTVYTIDLLGCGRSEKAEITYTNFVFAAAYSATLLRM